MVFRYLNYIGQPKVTTIYEYRNLYSMDFSTLFGKLQEHEMELKGQWMMKKVKKYENPSCQS